MAPFQVSLQDKMEGCPQLLDLIPKNGGWNSENGDQTSCEEQKLELSLRPPGEEWTRRGVSPPWPPQTNPSFLQLQPASSNPSSHKRAATGAVVGWPPVRSFRKSIIPSGSCSSKLTPDASRSAPARDSPARPRTLFVKINMDGVPIGRKVELLSCHGYEKLSAAVDVLFKGLLAAQNDSDLTADGEATGGLLAGEYTLVYEDNEGDRMLVGDVPWDMFVSTVKRLRVVKSSDLPPPDLSAGGSKPIN